MKRPCFALYASSVSLLMAYQTCAFARPTVQSDALSIAKELSDGSGATLRCSRSADKASTCDATIRRGRSKATFRVDFGSVGLRPILSELNLYPSDGNFTIRTDVECREKDIAKLPSGFEDVQCVVDIYFREQGDVSFGPIEVSFIGSSYSTNVTVQKDVDH